MKASVNDAARVETDFDFKRRALGVDDELKNVPGVTTPIAAFGENGWAKRRHYKKTRDISRGPYDEKVFLPRSVRATKPVVQTNPCDIFGVAVADCYVGARKKRI
jgi:hypothetical protein